MIRESVFLPVAIHSSKEKAAKYSQSLLQLEVSSIKMVADLLFLSSFFFPVRSTKLLICWIFPQQYMMAGQVKKNQSCQVHDSNFRLCVVSSAWHVLRLPKDIAVCNTADLYCSTVFTILNVSMKCS